MTRDNVNELLANHRTNTGRCLYLEAEIDRLRGEINRAKANLAMDVATAHNYELSDMPRGSAVGQPTERLGLRLASGWTPDYISDMERELAGLEREHRERATRRTFVEAWLNGLAERERWLIEQQVIDGVYWRDVLIRYRRKFGADCSLDTLKRVKAKALDTIYDMAR